MISLGLWSWHDRSYQYYILQNSLKTPLSSFPDMHYLNYPALPASVGHHPDTTVKQVRQVCCTVLPFYYVADEVSYVQALYKSYIKIKSNTDDNIKEIHLLYCSRHFTMIPTLPLWCKSLVPLLNFCTKTKQRSMGQRCELK